MIRIYASLALVAVAALVVNNIVAFCLQGDYNLFADVMEEIRPTQEKLQQLEFEQATASEEVVRLRQEVRATFVRLEPVMRRGSIQFLIVIAAALVVLLINCISITYFIGTSRWCKEVVDAYAMDTKFASRVLQLKRRSFPWSFASILTMLVIASLAGASNIGVSLHSAAQFAMPYMVFSWLGTLLIAWSFIKQRQFIGQNFALIGEVVEQVELCRERSRPAELIA